MPDTRMLTIQTLFTSMRSASVVPDSALQSFALRGVASKGVGVQVLLSAPSVANRRWEQRCSTSMSSAECGAFSAEQWLQDMSACILLSVCFPLSHRQIGIP